MLESLKSLWARWKVQVTVVGGALVVATAYGTCSFDPQTVSEAPVEPAVEVTTATPVVPVSEVTPITTEDASNTENTTTGE